MAVAPTSSHAQAPPLGTAAIYGVLAGSTITNTGPTVINGGLGLSPGAACTGFIFTVNPSCSNPLGAGSVTGPINVANALAVQAQSDNTIAFLNLASRPPTANLTGQDLGGLTLGPGVYRFDSSAQLTGNLTLNGLGNPNAVFIFQIGSALTTASASSVSLINGAQGANVFWQVGSSATLGTTTSFVGDILALTSITLTNGATINCGDALAQTGAVTLDTNVITICQIAAISAASALPSTATANQRAVGAAIDAFVASGGTLPAAFLNLLSFLSPSELAAAFTQLSGELGTGAAQAGTQAMNSFLSMLTNPFADHRQFPETRQPLVVKALGYAPERPLSADAASAYASFNKAMVGRGPDPSRWGVWASAYGGQGNTAGDPLVGSHDRSVRTLGYAIGFDYRVTPDTVAGFALAGGRTNYGLSEGLGGGQSDMLQAAAYTLTRIGAAYVSAALAYAWHRVSTDRYVTLAGTDHLTADFSANNVGGRIEGGYRFVVPGLLGWLGFGFTPYAAFQAQAFRTPSYSESAAAGSAVFALSYEARTTTTTRTELGAWFDRTIAIDRDTMLTLRTRAAWAHDNWTDPSATAGFLALPGTSFTVFGAAPDKDLLLASAGGEVWFRNGFSFAAWFDGEFAEHTKRYAGTARLRYVW
jgi:uncharacterized protein with beta-barrel porin domain